MEKETSDSHFAGTVGGDAVVLRSFASHHSHQFSGNPKETLRLVLVFPIYALLHRIIALTNPNFNSV